MSEVSDQVAKKILEDVGGELVDEALGAVEVVVVFADDAGKAGGSGTHRKVEQVVHLQMAKTFTLTMVLVA